MRSCALSALLLSHIDHVATSVSTSKSQSEVVFFAIVDVLARCTEFPAALSQALIPSYQRFVVLCFHCLTVGMM